MSTPAPAPQHDPLTKGPVSGEQFDDDWESHWDAYGGVLTGSPAKPFRYDFVLKTLRRLGCGSDDLVLELGAGTGDFLGYAGANGFTTLAGVEYAHSGVKRIRQRLPQAVAQRYDLMEVPDLADWTAPPAAFAVCIEVLEHVDDPVVLLKNARAFLAPGCRLVITVPGGPRTTFDKHIGHRQHFTPQKIEEVCRAAGYEVERAGRIGFPFFNLYRSVIYLLGSKVQDHATTESLPKRIFSAVFRFLFKLDVPCGLGWQVYAIARAR
ncbi:MAG: class I SAM-dependent methyltransferase [Pseudomonadota bacterium]